MKIIFYDDGSDLSGPNVYNGMTMTGMLILNKYPTDGSEAVNKEYVDGVKNSLNAERVLSGIMRLSLFPDMVGDLTSVSGSGLIDLRYSGVQPGVFTKVTVNRGGIVTSGGTLNAGDIPGFSWNKISAASRPNTAPGYGITDAVNRINGTVTGNVRVTYTPEQPEDLVNVSYVEESISNVEAYSVGDIVAFDTSVTPDGFLRCNGGSVSKAMYSELYSVVGDNFTPGGIYIPPSGRVTTIDLTNSHSVPKGATNVRIYGRGGSGTPERPGDNIYGPWEWYSYTGSSGCYTQSAAQNLLASYPNVPLPTPTQYSTARIASALVGSGGCVAPNDWYVFFTEFRTRRDVIGTNPTIPATNGQDVTVTARGETIAFPGGIGGVANARTVDLPDAENSYTVSVSGRPSGSVMNLSYTLYPEGDRFNIPDYISEEGVDTINYIKY